MRGKYRSDNVSTAVQTENSKIRGVYAKTKRSQTVFEWCSRTTTWQ